MKARARATVRELPLIRPPLGQVKVSILLGWPHLKVEFVLTFQSVQNTEVATVKVS